MHTLQPQNQFISTAPSQLETDPIKDRVNNNITILRQFKQGDLSRIKDYTGFGGCRALLKQESTQAELAEFLSQTEIEQLLKSTHTGYFTPPFIIQFIYDIVQKLGFTQGNILEPACGHGAFFDLMPTTMRENSNITGIEFEPLSAEIAKALYPDIRILKKGFHHFHKANFDLIIGNPPYASFSVFDKRHPDLSEAMIHHYFVAKSVRLLKESGLLAMVVPCYLLDNPNHHLRDKIAEVANLVTAFRLPENLFSDAKITVDVVIFQRSSQPKKNWMQTRLIELAEHERLHMSNYFIDHPEHVIGELDTYEIPSHYDDKPRKGLKCVASLDEVKKRLPDLVKTIQPLTLS